MREQLTAIQKRAIAELHGDRLSESSDDELRDVWSRLQQWHTSAVRGGAIAEPIEVAASFVAQEMSRRGESVAASDLAAAVIRQASLAKRLELLPDTIVIEQNEIELVCGESGKLHLFGAFSDPLARSAVTKAAAAAGIPVSPAANEIWGSGDTFTPLYDLALVRSRTHERSASQGLKSPAKDDRAFSAMLALALPTAVVDAMDRAGVFVEDRRPALAHVTLLYLGPAGNLSDGQLLDIHRMVGRVCRHHRPLTLTLTGAGEFAAGPDGVPVVALVSSFGISMLQADLERAVGRVIMLPAQNGFVPHVTLGYVPEEQQHELPSLESIPSWTADAVRLQVAGQALQDVPLLGHAVPEIAPWDAMEPEPDVVARSIACAASEKQVIYYLVSEPNAADAHGHRISAEDIEAALHGYVANSREVKLEHRDTITGKATVVEAYVAPADLATFHGQVPPDGPIKQGSSIVAIHYSDPALWQELRDAPHGISWGGMAARVDR
jgi:2'-5' RNA ligase